MVYHKIPTVFKRDPATKFRTLLEGVYATPELAFLAENIWAWEEKLDGTNTRVTFNAGTITFGGKTDKAQMPTKLMTHLMSTFMPQVKTFEEVFKIDPQQPPPEITLFGEGVGPKIQKGGENYGDTQRFVLFDVRVNQWWLKREDVLDVAKRFGIPVAPFLRLGTLPEMVKSARNGIKSSYGDFQAEGYVARPLVELKDRSGQRIITKIKCKDFR